MKSRRAASALALVLSAVGCGSGAVATAPGNGATIAGVVRADGAPVADAWVVMTDLDTHDEIAMVRTDGRGRFRAVVSLRAVALSAATDDAYAHVPRIELPADEVVVDLRRDCVSVDGRVDLEPSADALDLAAIRIGRMSEEVGDVFARPVERGRFSACVPAAEYFVELPDAVEKRTFLFPVPHPGELVIHATSRKAARTAPTELDGLSPLTRDAFVARLPTTVTALGLGETNHGSAEFTTERLRIAEALARTRGFRLILIEASFGETVAIDDYLQGRDIDVRAAVAGLHFWMFDHETFLEVMQELRAYNVARRPEERIHLVGFDVQHTSAAVALVSDAPVTLTDPERAVIATLAADHGRAWKTHDAATRDAIRIALERVASDTDTDGPTSARNRAALAARALLRRLDHVDAEGFWPRQRARDAGMADLALAILATSQDGKATLWAHAAHLSREWTVGADPAGAHLSRVLGDRYATVALLAESGTARAWDPDQTIGVVPTELPPAPSYSVEGALSRRAQEPVSYWWFDDAKGTAATWVTALRLLRSFGAVAPPPDEMFELVDLEALDGVVLFRKVTAPVPTPTGERRAR